MKKLPSTTKYKIAHHWISHKHKSMPALILTKKKSLSLSPSMMKKFSLLSLYQTKEELILELNLLMSATRLESILMIILREITKT